MIRRAIIGTIVAAALLLAGWSVWSHRPRPLVLQRDLVKDLRLELDGNAFPAEVSLADDHVLSVSVAADENAGGEFQVVFRQKDAGLTAASFLSLTPRTRATEVNLAVRSGGKLSRISPPPPPAGRQSFYGVLRSEGVPWTGAVELSLLYFRSPDRTVAVERRSLGAPACVERRTVTVQR